MIYFPKSSSVTPEAQRYCICWLCWSCVTTLYFCSFPLSGLVKVDLSWNLHLADDVPPQCAQNEDLSAFLSLHGEPPRPPCQVPSLRKLLWLCQLMSPTSSAVRLDGNQNFLAVFSEHSSFVWCQSGKSLFLFYCQEAELVSNLLFQGQIQAVSRGTSPTWTTE